MARKAELLNFAAQARECRSFTLIAAIKRATAKPAMDDVDFEVYSAARAELIKRGHWHSASATRH